MHLFLAFLLWPSIANSSLTDSPNLRAPFERRAHSSIESRDHTPLYNVTVVTRTTESEDQTLWLVEDALTSDRYILTKTLDFTSQELRYQIAPLGSKSTITASEILPFHARTRSDTFKAFHELTPEQFAQADTEWTVDTGGFKITAHQSEWRNLLRSREWRSELRRVASPALLEALERMNGTLFATLELRGFSDAVASHLLHRASCPEPAAISIVRLDADCAFDASFGYDCSNEQKRRIEQARSEHQPTNTY